MRNQKRVDVNIQLCNIRSVVKRNKSTGTNYYSMGHRNHNSTTPEARIVVNTGNYMNHTYEQENHSEYNSQSWEIPLTNNKRFLLQNPPR